MSEIIGKLEDFSLGKSPKKIGSIQKIGVIGCGEIGQEISKTVSKKGFDVIFMDNDADLINKAIEGIGKMLDNEISNWGMTNTEKRLILSRIKPSTSYKDLSDCDIVLEAFNTSKLKPGKDIRQQIFKNAEENMREDAILASNTATLMISDLSSILKFPERAVGLHFLTPADNSKVLEVVRSAKTSDSAYEMALRFARMLEKTPIELMESPGNISTRMICVIINQACEIMMEGIASVKDIDHLMRDSLGHQFGPFELADRLGLDKVQKWMDNLYNEFGELAFKTSPVIKRLVRANNLGYSTGKGFYEYNEDGKIIGETITTPEYK